jgi:hypothetical protein
VRDDRSHERKHAGDIASVNPETPHVRSFWQPQAAHRTTILCSLVQTCKHLQINPFVYLRDVIERISTHPARLVLELADATRVAAPMP